MWFALRILLRHEISLRSEEPLAREVPIHGEVGGTLPRATLPFPNLRPKLALQPLPSVGTRIEMASQIQRSRDAGGRQVLRIPPQNQHLKIRLLVAPGVEKVVDVPPQSRTLTDSNGGAESGGS